MVREAPDSYLNAAVSVTTNDLSVVLTHGALEVHLTHEWLEANQCLHSRILGRPSGTAEFGQEAAAVWEYLLETGFVLKPVPDSVSGPDALKLVRSLLAEWYGRIYRHELWGQLMSASSWPLIAAWIAHTEDMMRCNASADLLCAHSASDPAVRQFMKKSAQEEGEHLSDFSVFRMGRFSDLAELTQTFSNSPATSALSRQLSYMAQEDTLAYLAFSFFLESSGSSADESARFYADVESSFELNDFFMPWIEHIFEDKNLAHFGQLSLLIESSDWGDGKLVRQSVERVRAAISLLAACYDELVVVGSLRSPRPW